MRVEWEPEKRTMYAQLFMAMFYTMLFFVMASMLGCGGGGGNDGGSIAAPAKKVLASITVQPTDNKLAVGKKQQFTAVCSYTDGTTASAPDPSLIWSSSSPSVATIDSNGLVSGVTAGETTIKATVGAISGTTRLTVPKTTLVSIAITPSDPTIAINTSQQFSATGAYSDGTFKLLTTVVTWNSSDTSKVTIAADGKATGVASGTATITATSGSTSASTTLKVTTATLVSITVTPSNQTVAAGTTPQLSAIGTFSDNSTQDLTTQVAWSSSASSIASIAQNGLATAVAIGPTTINATSGTISATTTLNVTSPSLISIAVTPPSPNIAAGAIQQFKATGTFSGNTTQDLTTQVTWSSSVGSVADIAQNGTATALTVGTTTITAMLNGVSGTQNLSVTNASLTGTWEGTYKIYDAINPNEIGTYTFKLVLNQSGASITGSSSLRYGTVGQLSAEGQFTEATVTGRQINFTFTYIDPRTTHKMVNIGTATITDTTMTGDVLENYNGGYNCSYIFNVKKI